MSCAPEDCAPEELLRKGLEHYDFREQVSTRGRGGTVIGRKGLVIWDGPPAPRLRKAKDIRSGDVRSETGGRVHLGQRLSYASTGARSLSTWVTRSKPS